MNFLAHLELAPDDDACHLGAILGDFIRGRDLSAWPAAVERGIRLHRAIDRFTDSDPAFPLSRSLLRPDRRRFAGLIIDVFYDHLLARDWCRWHPTEPLANWTARVQQRLLNQPADLLAGEARQVVEAMVEQGWLTDYASLEGVDRAMKRMSRRRPFLAVLAGAGEDLRASYGEFEEFFSVTYPRLREQVAGWLAGHPPE